MGKIERYLEEVSNRIYASPADKERFLDDLKSHILEAVEAGDTETTVLRRMGTPEDVADEFMDGVELKPANIVERFIAHVVDLSVIHSVPLLLLLLLITIPTILGGGFDLFGLLGDLEAGSIHIESVHLTIFGLVLVGLGAIAYFGLYLLYFPLAEYHFGKTIGKHLMGIRVVDEKGAHPGLAAVFIRRLSYYFEIMFLDSLFIFFNPKRQRAFDLSLIHI